MTQNNKLIDQIVEVLKRQVEHYGEPALTLPKFYELAATEIASLLPSPEARTNTMSVLFKNKEGDQKAITVPLEKLIEHFGDFFYDELENTSPPCNCTNESNSHCECGPSFGDYEIKSAFVTPAPSPDYSKLREEFKNEWSKRKKMNWEHEYVEQSGCLNEEDCLQLILSLTPSPDYSRLREEVESHIRNYINLFNESEIESDKHRYTGVLWALKHVLSLIPSLEKKDKQDGWISVEEDEEQEADHPKPDFYTCMCCGNVQQGSLDCNRCAGPVSESFL